MTPEAYVSLLKDAFQANPNPGQAAQMEAYTKHNARFYGIKTPHCQKAHLPKLAIRKATRHL